MRRGAKESDKRNSKPNGQSFLAVLDSRKRKIPGRWQRGSRCYAQLRVDVGNGRTVPRRKPLEASNRKRWSLHLLAGKLVEAQVVDTVSYETVRQTLKNALKPWLKKGWCIPPKANAEFVAAMGDVLEVYHPPCDPARPQVCFDEAAKQLLGEVRLPLPMRPGSPERVDSESQREGTAALFMVCEPLAGRRHVFVRARRTRLDFAAVIKTLCDALYPRAEKIVLVLDQLNTHGVASLYSAYPPAEARRLAERLEIHHTPKHGSWLNMAEIELSVLARQCLDERMENQEKLTAAVGAWEQTRDAAAVCIDWRFITADARIKLIHLYPHATLKNRANASKF